MDTTDVFQSLTAAAIYAGGRKDNVRYFIEEDEVDWDAAYDFVHYGTDTHVQELLITGRRPLLNDDVKGVVTVQRKNWGQTKLQQEVAILRARVQALRMQINEMGAP